MRRILAALALIATPLVAPAADIETLKGLREGDMKKLSFHSAPKNASDASFGGLDGGTHSLADFEGKVVLLNFWATWCAPCREEMPALDALQQQLGGEDFQVVTLATGRNSPQGIRRFFDEEGIEALPTYTDENQAVARDMAVLGLPVTVLLNREGREIARLQGGADWDSESARAIVMTLTGAGL